MKVTHLLNSAMMPAADGLYQSRSLNASEFAEHVRLAHQQDKLISYIGYPETAELLSELCKIEIPVNRTETLIANDEFLLIAKLKYRVNDPKAKGKIKPTIEDFEFRLVLYNTGKIHHE